MSSLQRRGIIGNGAERELRSLPSCVCREPMSYSWTRGEGAKKARQFYCGTTWVTLSKFMHLRKKEQRDVCVFQQQLWVEQALRPFPPSLSPSFYRHLAALGAMTHWPSKKHSSTHPEVIPAKSSSSSSTHNSSLFFGRQLKEQRVFSLLHCRMSRLIFLLAYPSV